LPYIMVCPGDCRGMVEVGEDWRFMIFDGLKGWDSRRYEHFRVATTLLGLATLARRVSGAGENVPAFSTCDERWSEGPELEKPGGFRLVPEERLSVRQELQQPSGCDGVDALGACDGPKDRSMRRCYASSLRPAAVAPPNCD
jgi:hypothetical protein